MKSNQSILSSRMCPDYSLPALAGSVDGTANGVAQPPGQMTRPVTFADVLTSVAEFYEAIGVQISLRSFPRLGPSGMMAAGAFWTLNTSEWPSAEEDCLVSSLAETLETFENWQERNPGRGWKDWQIYISKYFLSAKACRGILRRAEKRGRELPEQLRQALTQVASMDGMPNQET